MEIERTIKYSDGGMATGLVGEDQVKDLSFKIRVKEMPKSDTISLHEVVTIEPFDLGDEKNIVFSPFHMIFGDSSLAIFDALGVDEVAGLKREDCVEFLENLKKQGKTERDGSFIAGLCNFSGNNVFMFFNVQRLNFKGFASRVLPHEALHLARILITLRENKWVRENLTTPEWYLDPRGTFVDMNDNNEEFFAETLERTSAIAMDAWQRITGEKCYMDGGGVEDETKEVSDEYIDSIVTDISDYKIYGSAEGDVDAETITFYGDYNEEDKNYNIEIVFKVDDPYADYEYVTDDPDETEKMVLPSYHLQSIILIEDDMYNIQLTESQKEKISEAIDSQFNMKIAAAYDYAMKMDAYESQDETGRMEMPRKYFMKDGGDIHDLYQIIIYNRFGDEMHSYIIGDYEKAMENLKEDLKLAETGSRVDISHNGEVIYSETKKQYKNGGGISDKKTYRVPVSKKISQQDVDVFVKYAQSFYGENNKVNNMYGKVSDEEVKKAVYQYIYDLSKLPTWSKDSMDRERVSQYLTKEIKSIFDLMPLYESNDGIKGDDYYYVVDFEKIPKSDVDWFINYVYSFYGSGGVRGSNPYTREQIEKAVYSYLNDLEQFPSWGDGDSIDRERVGQYLEGTTIFTGMYSYKNGGGIEAKNGAIISWDEATEGDSAFVVDENKMGLIIKAYGRRFHLKFADGTAKTYSANELVFYNFEKNEEMENEYKHGGGVGALSKGDVYKGRVVVSEIGSYSNELDAKKVADSNNEFFKENNQPIVADVISYNKNVAGKQIKVVKVVAFKKESMDGVGDFKDDGNGNYTNAEGYSLINQFDGTYKVLDPEDMDIVGEYVSLKDGKQIIKDYMEQNEKYTKGGGFAANGKKIKNKYHITYNRLGYTVFDKNGKALEAFNTERQAEDFIKYLNKGKHHYAADGKGQDYDYGKYATGGGVGMAMEEMFLDDEFERMVEKLKNYLAKYPYIWTRGTKRYVPIEGWQYAAALMGLSSRVKNVNEIQPGVWQAEADVVDKRSGVVNCSGFAIVNKAEHKWAKKDEDVINFVQTRAVSRALRNCISYLIKAAGYSTTPAEEMYGLASEEKKKKGMPSSIKPVKGVSEDDFIFDRPEYNEGMTQPPFPKEEVPITKYVPREEIPQEDMLRKVWAESKANGIVIRSAEFMNEIELALTDETIGTETQIKSLLTESYNWLTENGMVLRSKIFMKKFKDSL